VCEREIEREAEKDPESKSEVERQRKRERDSERARRPLERYCWPFRSSCRLLTRPGASSGTAPE